jgi:hypothetical protein
MALPPVGVTCLRWCIAIGIRTPTVAKAGIRAQRPVPPRREGHRNSGPHSTPGSPLKASLACAELARGGPAARLLSHPCHEPHGRSHVTGL